MKRYARRTGGFFWGTILILAGIIWLLKNMNLIPLNVANAVLSWQMFLIVWGVLGFIRGHWAGGAILIFVGSYFILPLMATFPYWVHALYWPAGLILLGIILIFHRNRRCCRAKKVEFIS